MHFEMDQWFANAPENEENLMDFTERKRNLPIAFVDWLHRHAMGPNVIAIIPYPFV